MMARFDYYSLESKLFGHFGGSSHRKIRLMGLISMFGPTTATAPFRIQGFWDSFFLQLDLIRLEQKGYITKEFRNGRFFYSLCEELPLD